MNTESIPKDKVFSNPQGVRYTRELFFETTLKDKSQVLYTLKDRDHEGFPSLYRLYLETDDITEYLFANLYLEGWDHWSKLCRSGWFKPYITRWREELALKIEARILKNFQTIAASGLEGAFQANKILLDRVRKPKEASKRGRPSNDDVQAEIQHQIASNAQIDKDAERILNDPT